MGIDNYRHFIAFLVALTTSVFYDAAIVAYQLESQLMQPYSHLATFNGVVYTICLLLNAIIFTITVPIIYKQIKGCKKGRRNKMKRPCNFKCIDAVKALEASGLDSTSDTASMLIRETGDSNSDISSKSSLSSQYFTNSHN